MIYKGCFLCRIVSFFPHYHYSPRRQEYLIHHNNSSQALEMFLCLSPSDFLHICRRIYINHSHVENVKTVSGKSEKYFLKTIFKSRNEKFRGYFECSQQQCLSNFEVWALSNNFFCKRKNAGMFTLCVNEKY